MGELYPHCHFSPIAMEYPGRRDVWSGSPRHGRLGFPLELIP